MYAHVHAKISYRIIYFIVSIIQGRKYLVIFTFAVLSDYKNSSTMKISGFMVEVKNCVACGGVEEILVHNTCTTFVYRHDVLGHHRNWCTF